MIQTVAIQKFTPLTLSTSEQTVYTVPASRFATIQSCFLYNDSGATVTVSVWLVPSAGSTALANKVLEKKVASKHTLKISFKHTINTGDRIIALASANTAVSINGSAAEFEVI